MRREEGRGVSRAKEERGQRRVGWERTGGAGKDLAVCAVADKVEGELAELGKDCAEEEGGKGAGER